MKQKREKSGRWKKSRVIAVSCLGLAFLLCNVSFAAAGSGCVKCHTDEEMLEDTAAPVVAKKSALQSGAG